MGGSNSATQLCGGPFQPMKTPYPIEGTLQPPRPTGSLLKPLKTMSFPPTESSLQSSRGYESRLDAPSQGSVQYGLGLNKAASSTGSTWNQTFTSSWSNESDVDPDRFSNFMKQAMRPKWEGGRTHLDKMQSEILDGD